MVGHVEPEDLRGADEQDGLAARRVAGKAALEQAAEQMAQRAQPPQYGGGQAPHQRAVAVGERREAGMGGLAGKLLVERQPPAQDAVEDIGGNPAGGEARDFRLGRSARARHLPTFAHEMCPCREARRKNVIDSQV